MAIDHDHCMNLLVNVTCSACAHLYSQAPSLPNGAPVDIAQRELDKDVKIKELRSKLTGEAGDKAGKQLVQGERWLHKHI